MKNGIKQSLLATCTTGVIALASQGAAAFDITETYVFNSHYYNSATKTVTAKQDSNVQAEISGWYGATGPDTSLDDVTDKVVLWSGGLGINDQDNPNNSHPDGSGPDKHHTIDNDHGYEYLAIDLEEEASLHTVKFGWREKDSDFSIFYLKPGETFDSSQSMISRSAFALAAHFVGAQSSSTSGTDQTINLSSITAGITSAVWLVAGYNSSVAGTKVGGVDEGSYTDGFKLLAAVTKRHAPPPPPPNDIPLPATALLFGLGLLFLRKPQARGETQTAETALAVA